MFILIFIHFFAKIIIIAMRTKLKEILETEGITQVELHQQCKLSIGAISRFANGKEPNPVSKSKLVKALNEIIGKEKYNTTFIFSK